MCSWQMSKDPNFSRTQYLKIMNVSPLGDFLRLFIQLHLRNKRKEKTRELKSILTDCHTLYSNILDKNFQSWIDMKFEDEEPKPVLKPGRDCDVCGKTFRGSTNYFNKHKLLHQGISDHECYICGRQFIKKSHLDDHIRTHTREKPFKCEKVGCGKAFSVAGSLKRHLVVHSRIRKFQCRRCQKRFTRNDNLQTHIKQVHDNVKKYKCPVCYRRSHTKGALNNHMRTHDNKKPFQCTYCSKKFSVLSSKCNHERIHTGEKPHKCQQCDKAFIQKCHLTRHIQSHTGEKPYDCRYCGKKFSQTSNMYKHQNKVHFVKRGLEMPYYESSSDSD